MSIKHATGTTQAIRSIYTSSQSESEINRRLRELIEYMGWKSGWKRLRHTSITSTRNVMPRYRTNYINGWIRS